MPKRSRSFNSSEYDKISQHFHLPSKQAASKLGVCETNLKKRCRDIGIERWPNRKVQALQKLIEKVESVLEKCNPEDHAHCYEILKGKLELLQLNLKQVLSDPDYPLIKKSTRIAILSLIKETLDLVTKQPSQDELSSSPLRSTSSPLRNNPYICESKVGNWINFH